MKNKLKSLDLYIKITGFFLMSEVILNCLWGNVLEAASSTRAQRAVILDTDPALGVRKEGYPRDVDDGLAIIEAMNAKELKLLGVSTVFGNSSVDQGTKVAKQLMALKRVKLPILKGASGPATEKTRVHENQAVNWMAKTLKNRKATIIALGPLTNVARLIRKHPEVMSNIEEIIAVMGRSPGLRFMIGEKGPVRDFNFRKDVKAAQYVMTSKVPITLAPFELSVQVGFHDKDLLKINRNRSELSSYLYKSMKVWLDFWKKQFPTDKGFHPWDSAAIATLLHPELFRCEKRSFRFSKVSESAHGLGRKETGNKQTQQIWFELSNTFQTTMNKPSSDQRQSQKKINFCFDFKAGKKEEFKERVLEHIY
jgi:pyrimidine-specific ribonucleoside hydrolase